jgi:trigger factor
MRRVMKTSLEDISSVKKKLIIEIESKEVDKKINEAYRELGKRAKIPGFRPGKVPRKILERRFSDDVTEDVTRELINESFPQAITEVDTMPLGAPLLEKETLKQSENFKYSAVIEVRPQFELKDYLGIEVEKEKYSVTDKDVEDRIEQIRQSNGNMNSIEPTRAVREEDYVVLDYEAFEGESPLDDVKANNFLIKVGSNDFHPQFEKELVGLNRDDEVEIDVDFEEGHYNSNLAGKSVKFKVKIVDIKEMVLPELNDEFAKNLGADFNTLEDLRTKIQEMISNQENNRIDKEMKDRLLNKITESVDFETPQVLIESELDYAVENFKQSLTRSGSSFEQTGITEEKLRSDFRPASEKRVKEMLVLEHIAKTDKITVGEEELGEAYNDLAANMGMDAEVVRQYYEARDLVDSLKEKLIAEKTLNYLVESAKVFELDRDALSENKSSEKEKN